MLGVYDYTVVLTYVSLMVSIGGMMFAVNGHLHLGVMCLAISGLCDMFDGKIARTKKNRTEVEKRFGIQIDSLSDIVCFGVAPAVLCYCFGNGSDRYSGSALYALYEHDVMKPGYEQAAK